ncbi:hypothetical protein Scep_023603 [Stephania cephalantha]|uniref:Uncharacterized protein n=1 Tax=Stephania cephalantha TaxID=152367 RepID=A0AAP0F0F6_9MAGN
MIPGPFSPLWGRRRLCLHNRFIRAWRGHSRRRPGRVHNSVGAEARKLISVCHGGKHSLCRLFLPQDKGQFRLLGRTVQKIIFFRQAHSFSLGDAHFCYSISSEEYYTHSDCLDRVRKAHNMSDMDKEPTNLHVPSIESTQPTAVDQNERPTCPLCRGEVIGWVVIEEVRMDLNKKKRCCEE